MPDTARVSSDVIPGTAKRQLFDEVRRKLGSVQGVLGFLVFTQLLTLAGLGGLLWHTFLRAG